MKTLPEAPRLANGRLDELISSLHSVLLLVDPSRDGEFREAIASQVHRHVADEMDCIEAELAEALTQIEPDSEGRVAVSDVVKALGWDTADRASATRTGRLLRRSVGLEPLRFRRDSSHPVSGYLWDQPKIEKFVQRYTSLSPSKGCAAAQSGLFSQLDEGVQPFVQPVPEGRTVEEVAQGERATSDSVQPTGSEVAQNTTPSEQRRCSERATVQAVQPTIEQNPVSPDAEETEDKYFWPRTPAEGPRYTQIRQALREAAGPLYDEAAFPELESLVRASAFEQVTWLEAEERLCDLALVRRAV